MAKIIIDSFHEALNKVSQPFTKRHTMADEMQNVVLSSRNAVSKRAGINKLNTSAYASAAEIRSIYNFERHEGGLLHKYLFNTSDGLYEFHLNSGVAGKVKTLTPTNERLGYAVAGKTCYFGDSQNSFKYSTLVHHVLSADLTKSIDVASTLTRLGQSFTQPHGNTRSVASISVPLIRTGGLAGLTLTLEIRGNTGTAPDALVATATTIPASSLSANWEWVPFFFSSFPTLTSGTKYWIVLTLSGAVSGGDSLGWAVDSTAGYTGGNWAQYSGSWTADNTIDGLFAVFSEPELWGIAAPTTAPAMSASAAVTEESHETNNGSRALNDHETGNLAQSFKVDDDQSITEIQLRLTKTGSPLGNIRVRIEGDFLGTNPDGITIGEQSDDVDATGVGTAAWTVFNFTDPIQLIGGTTYWLVLEGDPDYTAAYSSGVNEILLHLDTAAGYSDGKLATYAAGTWTLQTEDANFRIIVALRFKEGGRSYRFSYKNSLTGHVSNPSNATVYTGNTTSLNLQLTGLTASADPQVDRKIIWSTTDGGGIWFQLAEIANSVTTFDDNYSDDELDFDTECPFDNYPASANPGNIIKRIGNSILVSGVRDNPRNVYVTGSLDQILVGVPEECFPPLNFQGIPSGAERVFAVEEMDTYTLVYTSDQIFVMEGNNSSNLRIHPFRGGKNLGTITPEGVISTERGVFFLSSDKKVYWQQSVTGLPVLISGPIEDALEGIASFESQNARITYINFQDYHWLVLAVPIGTSANVAAGMERGSVLNTDIYVFDLELHDQHPSMAWMGPWKHTGSAPFQSIAVLQDELRRKRLFVGDNAGFIREVGTLNRDDGSNIVAFYTFPLMDDNLPQTVKDFLTIEVAVPASLTVPTLQISIDSESNYETITLYQTNEMERGASVHRYRGYILKQGTRIKPKITFAEENAAAELLMLIIEYEPLFEMEGMVNYTS